MDRAAACGAVQDQPRHTLSVPRRIGHRDRRAAGHAQQRESLVAERVDEALEVLVPRLEREIRDVPVGHPEASLVVADDGGHRTELIEEVPPDGAPPVVLEMAEPARHHDERRSATMDRVRDPHAAAPAREVDLLVWSLALRTHGRLDRSHRRRDRTPRAAESRRAGHAEVPV